MMFWLAMAAAWADPEDDAVWQAYKDGKRVGARRLAEERLAVNPDSIEAHHVLGMVLFYEEGSLAAARRHIHRAKALYEAAYPTLNTNDVPWKLYADILWQVQNLAGQMEEEELELETQATYNLLFDPDLVAEAAWPLMKLERFDEAREKAQLGIDSKDRWQQSVGFNALCAIESEANERQASFDACNKALDHEYSDRTPDVTVDANNVSLAAYGILRFDLVESFAKVATTGSTGSSSNPWGNLAYLYLSEGRGANALNALHEMQKWRVQQPANMRHQSRAGMDAHLAELLLVAGHAERGMDVITRSIEFPDRRGSTSGNADQQMGGHAMLRRALRRVARERDAERASASWLPTRLWHWVTSFLPDAENASDEATVVGVATREDRLRNTIRPHGNGGLSTSVWLVADLIPLVGTGVAESTVSDLREADTFPGIEAYYTALDAEIAWWRGQYRLATSNAASALAGLPGEEALLRARVAAIAADSAWRQGKKDLALGWYADVMQADPGTLRRMGLGLPAVVVDSSSDPVGHRVAAMLGRSPRIAWAREAFTVVVSSGQEVCLDDPFGARLACGTADHRTAEGEAALSDYDKALLTADAFHQRVFAMQLGLSAHDLDSLDGTTVLETQAAHDRMEQVLEGL